MELPDGINCDAETRRTNVCKLLKALYGLRISPKRWNVRFSEEALKLGLVKDINEPCLFTWKKDGKMVIDHEEMTYY